MSDLLEKIATQLRHFTHEEIVALMRDFLAGLDEKQQTRFRLSALKDELHKAIEGPRRLKRN
jgi:hypothetical protein